MKERLLDVIKWGLILIIGGAIISLFVNDFTGFAKEKTDKKYFDEVRAKAIHLVGEDGNIHASFYLGQHDSPQIVLYDKEGTNRFSFGLAPAGNPGMSFNDENFKRLIELDTAYGRATITLWSKENEVLWSVPPRD